MKRQTTKTKKDSTQGINKILTGGIAGAGHNRVDSQTALILKNNEP